MNKYFSLGVITAPLWIYGIVSAVLAFMWQYNIECWAGVEYVEWWKCFLLALIPGIGHLGFPAWVVTLIVWGL